MKRWAVVEIDLWSADGAPVVLSRHRSERAAIRRACRACPAPFGYLIGVKGDE